MRRKNGEKMRRIGWPKPSAVSCMRPVCSGKPQSHAGTRRAAIGNKRRIAKKLASISTTISNGGLSAEIGPTASYAAHVEFGTRRMRPQPFMRPAADQHFPSFEEAIELLGGDFL